MLYTGWSFLCLGWSNSCGFYYHSPTSYCLIPIWASSTHFVPSRMYSYLLFFQKTILFLKMTCSFSEYSNISWWWYVIWLQLYLRYLSESLFLLVSWQALCLADFTGHSAAQSSVPRSYATTSIFHPLLHHLLSWWGQLSPIFPFYLFFW